MTTATDSTPTATAEAPDKGVGCGDLVRLLGRTGGWRTRQQISNLIREMEECAGAARCCEDRKDWPEMLRHIADGLTAADKLRRIVK